MCKLKLPSYRDTPSWMTYNDNENARYVAKHPYQYGRYFSTVAIPGCKIVFGEYNAFWVDEDDYYYWIPETRHPSMVGYQEYCNEDKICWIKLSNKIHLIKSEAFLGSSVYDIKLPCALETIEDNAFNSCENLTAVHVPGDPKLESIDNYAFAHCSSLKDFEIPRNLIYLGKGVFMDCKRIHSMKLPRWLKSIGELCFCGCSDLTEITIPSNVKFIGECAFKETYWNASKQDKLIAYKAFNADWQCNKFQYQLGQSHHDDNGLSACFNPLNVFNYYHGELSDLKFAEVELSGLIKEDGDTVTASDLKLIREISASELAEIRHQLLGL